MTPEEIAAYLQRHPEFFEDYADMVASLYIPHPHGGRAISINERQILTLREKGKLLESKLHDLIRYGEENDAIGEKLHRLALALIAAHDSAETMQALYFNLREDFAVPHVALRLWRNGAATDRAECQPVSEEMHEFAVELAQPQCGGEARPDVTEWFNVPEATLKSFAYIPLRDADTFGLLVLASEDPQRFYPEMGTLYLKRLGDLAAGALAHQLDGA
ncbi:MAG TPA: DUF484 family protein [Burkholderiales bacterium]|jgi:uncharacterized protein YigA (DUF484 family)|nr:DUF484 family protein [Burkholderiales bacterium]